MVLLEFSMSPLGKGESVGKYVARSLEIVDTSGVDYRKGARGRLSGKVASVEKRIGRKLKT